METIGPAAARVVVGPPRRLVSGPDRRRPPASPRQARFLAYATPLALLALTGLGIAAAQYLTGNRPLGEFVAGVLAFGSVLPVVIAFRRPLLAWRVAYPMLFLGVFHAQPDEPWPWNSVQIVGFLFVLGALAAAEESGVTAWATALSMVPLYLFAPRANAWGAAVLLVAIAAIGDIVSRRRQTRRALAEQSEVNAQEQARRSALEERARIAREMHDVVAHHMSMIAVRAETAPYRVTGLPQPALAELGTIAVAARAALADMRRLLGVLRSETDETPTAPQPGLADLGELVEAARRAGVPATLAFPDLAFPDQVGAVPAAVGLAAYRIVQEALANAARHAPGGPVRIAGRVLADRLEVSVRNEPPPGGRSPAEPAARAGSGHGIVGMRERVVLLGGELSAGPASDGGYSVEVMLPLAAPGPATREDVPG
jgi:signal transduction histidine kinase